MIYTIGRLISDLSILAGNATTDFFGDKARMIAEEALSIFLSARWPFNEGEGAVATIAPYSTGTVAVVQGLTTVTLTGGTWSTSWPTPAVIRINGGNGESILVNSFDTAGTATLDIAWPFDSDPTADYSIEFPAHVIPSYISVTGVSESSLSVVRGLTPTTFEAMLGRRPWLPHSFWPGEYAVLPSDGTTSQKLFVWPPPAQVQTLRYRYVKAIPAFRAYREGVADATNSATAVVGTGTYWLKQGYSLVGQYFEFIDQPGHQVAVAAVPADGSITLAAGGYTGRTATGTPYWVSAGILCPDDLKPLLRSIVRWKYLQDAAPKLAPEGERRYRQLLGQAIDRYSVARDVNAVLPIAMHDYDWAGPPPLPSVLRVE